MASPFGKASSPFADKYGGSNNGSRSFEGPFQLPAAGQKSFGFGKVSPFADTNTESMPKNPFQQSKLFDDGVSTSKTLQTKEGISFLGHASTSPLSFGISSSFERTGNNQEKQNNPFQQSTPFGGEILAWGTSQTMARSLNILGDASTSPFCTEKAPPLAFISNEHGEKNPFQQSKAVGGEGLASKNSQTTTGSLRFGHASTSPFSFGKSSPFASTSNDHESKNPFKQSSPFASTSNDHESKNPFKQSTFLTGKSLASGTSQTMAGSSIQGNASFSSPFAISSNIHKPEPKNPFQNSTRDGNRSTWSQKQMGSSKIGGGSPSFIVPFGQPACYQNPSPPFASDPMKHM